MLTTLLSRAIGVLLLGLISNAHANGSMHYVPNDIHCPKDSQVGFVHNSYIYNAPLHQFTNITKSFFDIKWYGDIPATNFTGTNNVPGATRSGVVPVGDNPNNAFNDTLTMYSMHHDSLEYTYRGQPVKFVLPNQRPAHYYSYAETMRFQSICDGEASYIDLLSYLCADDQIAAYNLWYMLHMSTFEGLAASLGATVLAGDCPQKARRR
ncbi:hypothetical protein MVEN_00961000 [Mycena venus]|uniref:Uncharacterized protein n=1 Tax=Mycena venus TaxID=2733690 RepID=A0A8H7D250_9AGAR|nr:hypothetical protein MVEN_00961000 [Mycena venus]